jgi:hypothetical protein
LKEISQVSSCSFGGNEIWSDTTMYL